MKNNFKAALLTTTIAVSTASFSSNVQAYLGGNFGVASEYISRGVALSSDEISISGGLHYTNKDFYTGFKIVSEGDEDPYGEINAYAGYAFNLKNGLTIDGKIISYIFPYASEEFGSDRYEDATLTFSYGIFETGITYGLNGPVKDDLYYNVGVYKPITKNITLGAVIGHNNINSKNDPFDQFDFTHYRISASWKDFTLAVDRNDNELFDMDHKVSISWLKKFDIF